MRIRIEPMLLWLAVAFAVPTTEVRAAEGTDPVPPAAMSQASPAATDLGAVQFEVTGGSEVARAAFLRGILAMHSFWYEEAIAELTAAVAADPGFVMAHWGLAMAHSKLLFWEDDVAAGRAALAALPPLDGVTARERGWIEAARLLFTDEPVLERRQAFAVALGELHRAHPDDDEVATFHALALLSASPPDDPDALRVSGRAGALALAVLVRNPRHPGAAHYAIHAFDTPELAPVALPAARSYARIAPAAYHARHMPAHIFARLGMWEEALASCRAAWEASVDAAAANARPLEDRDYHSLSWSLQLALERGQRRGADEALAQARADVEASNSAAIRTWYVEMVTTYLHGTGEFARLDELLVPLAGPAASSPVAAPVGHACDAAAAPPAPASADGPPYEQFEKMQVAQLQMESAARRGDLGALRRHAAERDAAQRLTLPFMEQMLGPEMLAKQQAKLATEQGLERQVLEARQRRDTQATLTPLRELAALADARPDAEPPVLDRSPHEDLAEALAELGRPDEALGEWLRVLADHPNRGRVLLGAARAAMAAGQTQVARRLYDQLHAVWSDGDVGFPGRAEAAPHVAAAR